MEVGFGFSPDGRTLVLQLTGDPLVVISALSEEAQAIIGEMIVSKMDPETIELVKEAKEAVKYDEATTAEEAYEKVEQALAIIEQKTDGGKLN